MYMMSVHPSKVADWNTSSNANGSESKFEIPKNCLMSHKSEINYS